MHDAHLHLQDDRYENRQEAVWENARRAGVTGAVCCGVHPGDWDRVRGLSSRTGIRPAFGLHPRFVESAPPSWPEGLEALLNAVPDALLGEAGLDGRRGSPPMDRQVRALDIQCALAIRLQRPLVLHGARAWGNLLGALRPHARRLPPVLLHGFGAAPEMIPDFLRLGCYFSFNGTIVSPRARKARRSAALVPADHLLVETDSPDMFPENGRPFGRSRDGRPINQPSNLPRIAEQLAVLRGVACRDLLRTTDRNIEHLCKGLHG